MLVLLLFAQYFLPATHLFLMNPVLSVVLATICCLCSRCRGKIQMPEGYSKHQLPPPPGNDSSFNLSLSFNLVQGICSKKSSWDFLFQFQCKDIPCWEGTPLDSLDGVCKYETWKQLVQIGQARWIFSKVCKGFQFICWCPSGLRDWIFKRYDCRADVWIPHVLVSIWQSDVSGVELYQKEEGVSLIPNAVIYSGPRQLIQYSYQDWYVPESFSGSVIC